MARLSGHTGLKLSIRRLALYTRRHLLAVSPIVVAIGEVAVYITSAGDGPGGAFPGALPRWRRLRGACVSYMGTNHTL